MSAISQPTTPLLTPVEAVALDVYAAELWSVRYCIAVDRERGNDVTASDHLPILLAATHDAARALDPA